MTFLPPDRMNPGLLVRYARRRFAPNRADVIAAFLIGGGAVLVVEAARQMGQPLSVLNLAPVVLDPAKLPQYAVLTTLRMFAALFFSLLFTFVVATLAAKSRKAELVIVPALDILQSVPVLGFLTFTVTFYMGLFPGRELGVECAAVFAIFTAQAWNMAFSFYQSLKTLPGDLDEAARQFGLSPWQRFWRLELPFATPALVWNTMMSMSGSWFFVVASEAITVGKTSVALPGIGSWLALANEKGDGKAVVWAVFTMGVVIVLYDQLLFRPVVAWADKFRAEQTASQDGPRSWFYDVLRRARLLPRLFNPITVAISRLPVPKPPRVALPEIRDPRISKGLDWLWLALVIVAALWGGWMVITYVSRTLTVGDAIQAFGLGSLTLIRVLVLIAVASVIWVPIGVWIGLRPIWAERIQPVAQFLAAFPANVLFPAVVGVIVALHADPNIWLSPLMILGTQWYILFNVIAGAAALPNDLKEAAAMFHVRKWQWWRDVALPGVFPYYVTGALTASGGSWNASIVAEVVNWRHTNVEAAGLGSYIANATAIGDYPRVALGIAVMSVFVIALNRTLWRPMYAYASAVCTWTEKGRPMSITTEVSATDQAANLVEVRNVKHVYGKGGGAGLLVLDDVDLTLRPNEIVGLLGRSGSGKSTLLRTIAGLIRPTAGTVVLRDMPGDDTAHGVAMVFQSFALFPWLTVMQNVELGLEAQGVGAEERRRRALAAIDLIGLDGFENAYPKELSGGMRQRVGLARALVVQPSVLLMDEPFSALDVLTAETLRTDLLDLWVEGRMPIRSILMVTHNIEEAVLMCDRILVFSSNPGRVIAEIKVDLPQPRKRLDPAFRALVDDIYARMTARNATQPVRDGAFPGMGLGMALPDINTNTLAGMIEAVAASPHEGKAELPALANELNLEVDELLPIAETLQLMRLAEVEGLMFRLTAVGRRYAISAVDARKQMFAQQLLAYVPLAAHIRRVLDDRASHQAPARRFRDELEDFMSEDYAEEALNAVVAWGRYGEVFAYHEDTDQFSLEDPA